MDKDHSYIRKLLSFYFARRWQSLLTIFYFIIFSYFALFYSGNVWLTVKFIAYTISNSAELLELSYLFWGVGFLVALLVPFAASIYALILFYEIWNGSWETTHKLLATAALISTALLVILIADESVRLAAEQNELREFVQLNDLI